MSFGADPRKSKDTASIKQAFETAYLAQYGFNPSHVPIEIVSWRLTARGPEVPFHVAAQVAAAIVLAPGAMAGFPNVHVHA